MSLNMLMKIKPAGILIVSVSTKSNSIELVSSSHDGEDKSRKVSELESIDMSVNINKIYDAAIKATEAFNTKTGQHYF